MTHPSAIPFGTVGVRQCVHGRDVGDCDRCYDPYDCWDEDEEPESLDADLQDPDGPPKPSDGGVAATAVATTPPSTHALADALEKRLVAARKVDSHVDSWVLGWFIGIAPEAVANAIDAYERIGSPRATGEEAVVAGPPPAATVDVGNVL